MGRLDYSLLNRCVQMPDRTKKRSSNAFLLVGTDNVRSFSNAGACKASQQCSRRIAANNGQAVNACRVRSIIRFNEHLL